MPKSAWDKLIKLLFARAGQSRNERADDLSSKLNVNEEYKEAFRTKSYVEMWSKVQRQLGKASLNTLPSAPSLSFYAHLSDYLLEPQQETLMKTIESLHFHHLLIDYFESSLESYNVCKLLLRSVHQTRAHYRRIQRIIKLSEKADDYHAVIFRHLAAYASLKNPLSIISTVQFGDCHQSNMVLLGSLTVKGKKIRRRTKFIKLSKKVGGYSLVISQSALLVAMLVFLLHSMVGIVAAPGLVASCFVLLKKRAKLVHRGSKTRFLERFVLQLDVAAKGVYILINDFNTMCRMVKRLYDEVEHHKDVANMCIRTGKSEILKEVVKEFRIHETSFLEQLKELEEHIYLCFLTINRSRRLVLQEIMAPQHDT